MLSINKQTNKQTNQRYQKLTSFAKEVKTDKPTLLLLL